MHKDFKLGMEVMMNGKKGKISADIEWQINKHKGANVDFLDGSSLWSHAKNIEIIKPVSFTVKSGYTFAGIARKLQGELIPNLSELVCEYNGGTNTYQVVGNGNIRELTKEGNVTGVLMKVSHAQIFGDWSIKIPKEPEESQYHLVAKFNSDRFLNYEVDESRYVVSTIQNYDSYKTIFTETEADEILSNPDFASFKKQPIEGGK